MGAGDIIITLGVFAVFGYLILSKMKAKNPKRVLGIKEWFSGSKASFKKSQNEETSKIILPEDSRIM